MNRIFYLMLLMFISCSDNANENNFKGELYRVILDYQKSNPIPTKEQIEKTTPLINSEKSKYIYDVVFYKENNDTLISIKLLFGLLDEKNKFGVFSYKKLERTVITDECNCSKGFVMNYKKVNINKYLIKDAPIIDIRTDRYIYKIDGKKINFKEKLKF